MSGPMKWYVLLLGVSIGALTFAADNSKEPLTPVEARKKVGEKITVQMIVRSAKDRKRLQHPPEQ